MIILYSFIFIVINLSFADLYVDIKNKRISDGVLVFNGYFYSIYDYFMFRGENETISKVYYGNELMFPLHDDQEKVLSLFVEYFMHSTEHVAISILFEEKNRQLYKRIGYDIENGSFLRMHGMPCRINLSRVRLSLNIAENCNIHPFIVRKVTQNQGSYEISYSLINKFMGVEFDGLEAPIYELGHIFESGVPVYVVFTKVNHLLLKCDKIIIKRSTHSVQAHVEYDGYKLNFTKRMINSMDAWVFDGDIKDLVGTLFKKTFTIARKLVKWRRAVIQSRILDIREMISYELYNFNRVKGTVGMMEYKIYQANDPQSTIQIVFDSSIIRMILYEKQSDEEVVSVEVFLTNETILVRVNIKKRILDLYSLIVKMYEKINDEPSFIEIKGEDMLKRRQSIEKMYPIGLNVDIDEKYSGVYKSDIVGDQEFKFLYFYIYQTYDLIVPRRKFTIKTLSEVDPFFMGNIPRKENIKRYRIIKDEVNSDEILIRNPYNRKPLDTSVYEVYVRMQ